MPSADGCLQRSSGNTFVGPIAKRYSSSTRIYETMSQRSNRGCNGMSPWLNPRTRSDYASSTPVNGATRLVLNPLSAAAARTSGRGKIRSGCGACPLRALPCRNWGSRRPPFEWCSHTHRVKMTGDEAPTARRSCPNKSVFAGPGASQALHRRVNGRRCHRAARADAAPRGFLQWEGLAAGHRGTLHD